MRLIDADNLKVAWLRYCIKHMQNKKWKILKDHTEEMYRDGCVAIDAMPTIELPERKKGKWIPVTNGRGGFECDRCHCYAPSYQDGVEWLSAFCPNCGARMDGVSE